MLAPLAARGCEEEPPARGAAPEQLWKLCRSDFQRVMKTQILSFGATGLGRSCLICSLSSECNSVSRRERPQFSTLHTLYATNRFHSQSTAAALGHHPLGEEALETLLRVSGFVKFWQRQSVAATGQNGISNEHIFLKNKKQ